MKIWLAVAAIIAWAGQNADAQAPTARLARIKALRQQAQALAQEAYFRPAIEAAEEALELEEQPPGPRKQELAAVLTELANLYVGRAGLQSDYDRAQTLLQRAVGIYDGLLGQGHPKVAAAKVRLADLYLAEEAWGPAERLYREAQVTLGLVGNTCDAAAVLRGLARIQDAQGSYERSEVLHRQALTIRRERCGAAPLRALDAMLGLAAHYLARGLPGQARPLAEDALRLVNVHRPTGHRDRRDALGLCAQIYLAQGDEALGRAAYLAATTVPAPRGSKDFWLDPINFQFAGFLQQQGLYAAARDRFERIQKSAAQGLGPNHPEWIPLLAAQAGLDVAEGSFALYPWSPDSPIRRYTRILDLSERRLREEGPILTEARLTHLLRELRGYEQQIYSLLLEHVDPEVQRQLRTLALRTALLRKGRSVDEIAAASRVILPSLTPEERASYEELRARQVRLHLFRSGSVSSEDLARQSQTLEDEVEVAQQNLAVRSMRLGAHVSAPRSDTVLPQVTDALRAAGGVLIEIVLFERFDFRATLTRPRGSEQRYLALVLRPDSTDVGLVDLGPKAPIDRAIDGLLPMLAEPLSDPATLVARARDLHQRVMAQIEPLLGGRRNLFLSLDGGLNLVPFAALHDGKDFLLERYQLTYLTSGRDLLRGTRTAPRWGEGRVVVVADPDFTALPTSRATGAPKPGQRLLDGASTLMGNLGVTWQRLPGTSLEAEAIGRLMPGATLLRREQANKTAFLALVAPAVLHVATHGWFLADRADPGAPNARSDVEVPGSSVRRPLPSPPNPLLRSALVLAGANLKTYQETDVPGEPDGLATALEVAAMNLWGTQLVVLSACETGRGYIEAGLGVYGLRRAVFIAGAETLVTSLWKVNDQTTSDLMEGYYRLLLSCGGRVAAMRAAMMELRKRKPHPYYWAPFIVLGQGGSLRLAGKQCKERG